MPPLSLFGAPPNHDTAIERQLKGRFMDKDNSKPEGQEQTTGRRNRHSKSFRDQIIRYLHDEKGLSWPKAERGFHAVFELIGEAVRAGEVVELPGIGITKSVV